LGLMQLMPATSAEIGFKNISEPEANIQAGVLYLRKLSERFPDVRPSDRLAMVLAAYLIGPGHVLDAQELARALGLSPQRWHHGIEETLPLLEDDRFHPKTRLGYARGRLAVGYANRVLKRFDLYRKHLARKPARQASAETLRPAA
ncbi:MAG: transglycosylase SLT domain-containing protein, partial [Candidatus Binatia bacterium]